MQHPGLNDSATIAELLSSATTVWAVVGCSPDPSRDSHRIAALLQRHDKRVLPVNPVRAGTTILGETTYASLAEAADAATETGTPIEVVDIFRRADQAGRHVDEAIAIGARAVWLQIGVIDPAAAGRAAAAQVAVVMDRCPAIEYPKLGA